MVNIIEEKSFNFAVRVVNLYKHLTAEKKEFVLSKQLLRSGTSIGANIAEAEHPQSNADYLSKMNIALKEANETCYWLKLLVTTDYINNTQYNSINTDAKELICILTSILKTSNSSNQSFIMHNSQCRINDKIMPYGDFIPILLQYIRVIS